MQIDDTDRCGRIVSRLQAHGLMNTWARTFGVAKTKDKVMAIPKALAMNVAKAQLASSRNFVDKLSVFRVGVIRAQSSSIYAIQ